VAFSRKTWRARSPKVGYEYSPVNTLVIHHSAGSGLGIDTVSEQCAALRSIQNFHMDTQGWNDIGYNLICFQPRGRLKRARLYWGRPARAIPAAQAGHNTGTIALCVVADDEPISYLTKRRIIKAAKALKKNHGIRYLRGHRDYNATSCPGDHLYRLIPEIRRATGLR